MKLLKIMSKILAASLIIISLFSFCRHTNPPESKSIDYVSVPFLSNTELRAMKSHLNDDHILEAHKGTIKTPLLSQKYFNENKQNICQELDLDKISTNDLYVVAHLTYSLPYLNEKSSEFLDLLGKRMQKSFKEKGIQHYRFILTSVLRTQKDQRQLQRVNANATPSETSHYFGTTFDISQTRFSMGGNDKSVYSYRLRNLLARELIQLQEEGKCYVIIESRVKCFHVTVCQ